jgi:two-component system, NtrC family, response regulator AtoC
LTGHVTGPQATEVDSLATARESFERQYIVAVLDRVEGSKTIASRVLGLSRKALWEKCKRYGISSEKNGSDAAP